MGLNRNLGNLTEVIKESGGNVGVGVTLPKEKLEVAGLVGNIRIYGRSGIAQNQITSNVYYNGSAWVRDTSAGAVAISLDSNAGSLGFFTTSSTSGFPDERMRIFSSGNVFIGSSPTDTGSKLNVNGRINTNQYYGTNLKVTITALNTNFVLYPAAFSGLMTIRDNTYGGSAVWLVDPNNGCIQIANNMPGTFSVFYSGGQTYIQKTSGNVPVNYSYGLYSNNE